MWLFNHEVLIWRWYMAILILTHLSFIGFDLLAWSFEPPFKHLFVLQFGTQGSHKNRPSNSWTWMASDNRVPQYSEGWALREGHRVYGVGSRSLHVEPVSWRGRSGAVWYVFMASSYLCSNFLYKHGFRPQLDVFLYSSLIAQITARKQTVNHE